MSAIFRIHAPDSLPGAVLAGKRSGVLWLSPTPATIQATRLRLLDLTPSVFGIRLWTFADLVGAVLDEIDPIAPGPAQRRLVLEDVALEAAQSGALGYFAAVSDTAGFLDGLASLVGELQHSGISPAALARAAYRGPKQGPIARQYGDRTIGAKERDCALLYARYRREMRRLGLADQDEREALTAHRLRRGVPLLLRDLQLLVLDGFHDLSPAREAILRALAGRASEVWLSLPGTQEDEREELFRRPRRLARRFAAVWMGSAPSDSKPVGLTHLARELFRPLRRLGVSPDATGLLLLKAPGPLGEARLAAREVREWLRQGVPADDVQVVVRDLSSAADLLHEVFTEYAIPHAIEAEEPLLRSPAVALLLRALRFAEEDFPFAGVTALLRHGCFRPTWPEAESPGIALQAEALLRLLGQPRGRAAYLAAVALWAEREQEGLEDEQAEQHKRKRTHDLAKQCGRFLHRFFATFEGAPGRAPLAIHVIWVRHLIEDLGLDLGPEDKIALDLLREELERWEKRSPARMMDPRAFQRRLGTLAGSLGFPSAESDGPARVRILSANEARRLSCTHRILLGLGEGSYPRSGDSSLIDDADRQTLRQSGLPLTDPDDRLGDEMLLFYQLATGASQQLVLGYPAVDDRGQEMLPGSFLQTVLHCFTEGAIPTVERRMLLDQYFTEPPLSQAEYRVQVAAAGMRGTNALPEEVRANLLAAAELSHQRFETPEYGAYDGRFRDPILIEWVGKQFGPRRVFSPTALEDYVACPFRFFLKHVLHLAPLEEPREGIEVTRRGMAFHRALARLHVKLRDADTHQPTPETREDVLREIATAVDEDVQRAPSLAAKELWRLEGQRLLRSAERYPGHWSKFLEPWLKRGVAPRPHLFEVDFGLPVPDGQTPTDPLVLRVEGVEVRISGRIDRVDLADLPDGVGFWIIDYKTGRGSHYTGSDLAELRKLQLALYAVAVEAVLLGGMNARPLGLLYWLVGESGPKPALPGRQVVQWLDDAGRWPGVRQRLIEWVATLVRNVRQGMFPLAPRSEHCTQTCDFSQVCRISQSRFAGKGQPLPLPGEGTE